MRTRPAPLDIPPDRPPYFRVTCNGATWYLRAPSIHRVGRLLTAVTDEQRGRLVAVTRMVGEGRSLFTLATSAPDILELFGALLGIAWADPLVELETPAWTSGDLAAYGAQVLEEFHESGWTVEHVILAGFAVAREVQQATRLGPEVTAQAAFFQPSKAPSNGSESRSSASSSEPTLGDGSTN